MSEEAARATFGAIIRRRLCILNTEELAATLQCTPNAVMGWRKEGTGPRFARLGRRIFYREADIVEWAKERAELEDHGDEQGSDDE